MCQRRAAGNHRPACSDLEVSPCRRPPNCLRLQLLRHSHGLGCGCCHGGCGGCLCHCCCCSRGCSMGSISARLLLPAAPAARGWAKTRASPCQVARVAARVACEGSQGSSSAVSRLSIRATRMAKAWAADALPGACATSMGCSRSEHTSPAGACHPRQRTRARARAADAICHRAVARTCLARCASSDALQKNSVCLPIDSSDAVPPHT